MQNLVFQFSKIITLIIFFSSPVQAFFMHRTGQLNDKVTQSEYGVCLAGGGDDNAWKEGWQWILTKASGGDVVIIQSEKTSYGYESWIYFDEDHLQFPKVNSVTTLSIDSVQDSNRPEILKIVSEAELVFFAGGDQSLYIQYIENTQLDQLLKKQIQKGTVSFAGTSAGMALLAGLDFRARYPSPHDPDDLVQSEDVLMQPTGTFVDMYEKVLRLPGLNSVVTDTHFAERNRFGRLVGFMANSVYKNLATLQSIKGIGSDPGTALCINKNGYGRVFGEGHVYAIRAQSKELIVKPNTPLSWGNSEKGLLVYKMKNHDDFNLVNWTSSKAILQNWWVQLGQLFMQDL